MGTWVKDHFGDEQHARETVAKYAAVAAVIGFALVMVGMWLSR